MSGCGSGRQPAALHVEGRALHVRKTPAFLDRFLDLWLAGDTRPGDVMLNAAE